MYKLYQITNTCNSKTYIGITKLTIEQRWNQHLKDSINPKYPIHRAIHKYGAQNFIIEILLELDDRKVIGSLEEEFIVTRRSRITENGYNVAKGGYGGNLGEEVNAKRRATRANKSPEEKAILSKKLSQSHLGIRPTDEVRAKLSKQQLERGGYGPKEHSVATKRKMSIASKGKSKSQKTRLAMSASAIVNDNGKRFNGRRASCLCCHKEWDIGNYTQHIRRSK